MLLEKRNRTQGTSGADGSSSLLGPQDHPPHIPGQPLKRSALRRQRCLKILSGETIDRVPTYIPGIASQVASELLGRPAMTGGGQLRYAEVLALSRGKDAHAEFEARFMEDIVELHRQLDIDVFRMPWRMNVKPARVIDEHTFVIGDPEGDHAVWQYKPDSDDFGPIRTVNKQRQHPDWVQLEAAKGEARLREGTSAMDDSHPHLKLFKEIGEEFFVVCNGGGISVGLAPEALMALALEPDEMRRLLMVQAAQGIALGKWLANSGCPKVLMGGGDLADNRGPMYSPAHFRQIVLPCYAHMLKALNELGVHYVFRSDGNLWKLSEMLFDAAGCPGYGEVDRDASMTVAELRLRHPKLVIWGNMSSAFLHHRSAAEVTEEARRIVDESQHRGYFQGCSNLIVSGTPAKNVEALFSAR